MGVSVNDQHSFVARVESKNLSSEEVNLDSFGAKLVFTWSMGCIQGNILSSYNVTLPPPSFKELMIYIDGSSCLLCSQVQLDLQYR